MVRVRINLELAEKRNLQKGKVSKITDDSDQDLCKKLTNMHLEKLSTEVCEMFLLFTPFIKVKIFIGNSRVFAASV